MIRLSRSTGLHPKCLTIQNVEMLGSHPVAGGAFGDVWKGTMNERMVCLKVIRVYTASEVGQIIKVCLPPSFHYDQSLAKRSIDNQFTPLSTRNTCKKLSFGDS